MRSIGVVLLLTVVGCASVSKERGHDEVDRLVRERTGHPTRWAQGSPEDQQVDKWVGELVGRGLTQTAVIDIALLNNPRLQEIYEDSACHRPTWCRRGCFAIRRSGRTLPSR